MKKPSKKKKKELRTLLARPDNEIDLTDIPELSIGARRLSGNFIDRSANGSTSNHGLRG
jgi:hypothetical protein